MNRLGWSTVAASLILAAGLGTLGARVHAPAWAASAERLCSEVARSGHEPMQDSVALALVGVCGRVRR